MSPTLDVVSRWDGGISWSLAEDRLERTSHALTTEDGVWIIDPVDAPGLDDELDELGEVAGVTLLVDRHKRDTEAVAQRHGVPVSLPGPLAPVARDLETECERYPNTLPETGFEVIRLLSNPGWQEAALYDEERGTLVVQEALGANEIFTTPGERIGVHPLLRLLPPRKALSDLDPDRVLVGHGEGVFEDAGEELRGALRRSRRTAPRLYAGVLAMPFK
ncbi:MAG: hypothetical protein ABEH90_04785 [Halolamina sp.]